MMKPKKILITDTAQDSVEEIISYLISKFSIKLAKKFVDDLDLFYSTLSKHQELGFEVSSEKRIRCFVFKTYTLIFYTVTDDSVVILLFRDSRSSGSLDYFL